MQEQIIEALRRGDVQAALDAARGFAADAPDDAQAQRLLALALRSAGDAEGARAAIEQAISLAPDDARLHMEHAGLLLGVRDLDGAGQALEASVTLDPNAFPAYIMQAQLAMGRNDLDEAARLARLAARVSPDHPSLQALQGTLELRRGNTDEAMRLLSEAAQRTPEDPVALHALGFAYLAKGHLAFAEQAFRNLLKVAPRAGMVRLVIAQLLLRQGRPVEAVEALAPLLDDPATATPALRRLAGEIEIAAGRPDRALPLLREALAALPGESRTMAAIGEAWRRLGDFDDARSTLDAALATSPENDGLWRARLAFEPARQGAAALIARWRERRPESIDAMEAEMVLHASEGRPAEAEAAARALLERSPGHVRAEMRVIDALLVRDPQEAAQRLEALMARASRPAERKVLTAWLGLARHRSGDFTAALESWNRRNADDAADRLPLPTHTSAPASWPEPAAATPGAPPAAFLLSLPGSLVERMAQLLAGVVPTFRDDRFGAQPPPDAFQDAAGWARLSAGEPDAAAVVAGWRVLMPARGIDGAIIDWLPWWDHAYAAAMRAALPEAMLLVPLRDPRDMLVDWLAFGARAPFAVESPQAAADWLAAALDQIATLHEQDLVPHRLLRVDDTAEDPVAMSAQLGEALGIRLPEPPMGLFGAPRFAAGTWRDYAGLLAAPFAALAPVARRLGYPDA
ncbi:tetratricopeptide repeat protein [Luteimonas arsenica]|uniref:tetratricopeptide repeat protein n=1 Tax=Luteimonas arsenica TaxID=1586242 RepID=UPI0010554059|nr:tetratricopeptide repeat protein [Luteimonas arsenica]